MKKGHSFLRPLHRRTSSGNTCGLGSHLPGVESLKSWTRQKSWRRFFAGERILTTVAIPAGRRSDVSTCSRSPSCSVPLP